jgi:GNAT superfamily N-acetyltransferase
MGASPSLRFSRLTDLPVGLLDPLIRESVGEGWAHLVRLRDDWVSGTNRFDRRGEGLYLGTIDGRAVVVCGMNVDPYGGDPEVGRVRRMYVLKGYRRLGVGRMIVRRMLEDARSSFREIRLRTNDATADAFYRSLGFARVSGREGVTHALELACSGISER